MNQDRYSVDLTMLNPYNVRMPRCDMHLQIAVFLFISFSLLTSFAYSEEISIMEWDIPTANSSPHDIVVGRDGMVWFTEIATNKIGKFDPVTEEFSEYVIPTESSRPHGLVVDNKGNVWFTEVGAGKIGKFDPVTESFEEFAIPTPNSGPHTPIFSDETTLWFTEQRVSQIGKMDITTGKIQEFPTITPSANPYGIITDSDGNAWFAELQGHHVGKVDAKTGKVTEYPPPTANSGPRRIAIDSNGMLWITQYNSGTIAKFDPETETFVEYETSSISSGPYAIWVDPFDNVWFSMTGIYKIGKFDQESQMLHEYDLPSPQTHIKFIHTDVDGNIWFPNYNNNKIGVIYASADVTPKEIIMQVGPQLVDCVGVAKQKCMLVKFSDDSEWKMFYGNIEGFSFESSHQYELRVIITEVENPPADASSKKYTLLEIIKKNSPSRHMPYDGVCAPGFVPLGEICVLNDRCGPGSYPGKVCVMDGKEQPYLRPLQQGNAGIAASDVICAESLELLFKPNDGSPTCVRLTSIDSFKERGWLETPPVLACTLEYAPVCGVDGTTYGNMCMLDAQHIAIKHKGECSDKTLTEFELDTKYQETQNKISKVSKDIYNGQYNGSISLNDALMTLENAKKQLETLHQQYKSLDKESKADMQIAMRFSTLGKMGFASIDSQIMIIKEQIANVSNTGGVYTDALQYTSQSPTIDEDKGYFVDEIADGVYWLVSSGYQTIFLTTGQGVIVIDAPQPIGKKYLDAISDVTLEPITHMIYSHHHQDHTGAAGQIFPADIEYISHAEAADVLAEANDPNRPIPNVTFEGELETLTIGDQIIELHHLGNFHSNGDLLILLPEQNVAMLVDLLRPGASPYRAFGVTPDIDLYLKMHDDLQNYDFDVLVSGHTGILTTKDHIKTNKEFTLDVMNNAHNAIEAGDANQVETCIQKTTTQWSEKLDGLDTFMADHCQAMIDYHNDKN